MQPQNKAKATQTEELSRRNSPVEDCNVWMTDCVPDSLLIGEGNSKAQLGATWFQRIHSFLMVIVGQECNAAGGRNKNAKSPINFFRFALHEVLPKKCTSSCLACCMFLTNRFWGHLRGKNALRRMSLPIQRFFEAFCFFSMHFMLLEFCHCCCCYADQIFSTNCRRFRKQP